MGPWQVYACPGYQGCAHKDLLVTENLIPSYIDTGTYSIFKAIG